MDGEVVDEFWCKLNWLVCEQERELHGPEGSATGVACRALCMDKGYDFGGEIFSVRIKIPSLVMLEQIHKKGFQISPLYSELGLIKDVKITKIKRYGVPEGYELVIEEE